MLSLKSLKPLSRKDAASSTSSPLRSSSIDSAEASPAMTSTPFLKRGKVRFSLHLQIIDLNNVPLVSGTSFIKWHLPSSQAAEHRGRTEKCAIRDHRVSYNYEKKIPVRLSVGKDGMLQECGVDFEVLQEYGAGGRGERIRLGEVTLNLAEYVEASETPVSPGAGVGGGEEGVVRRYLMQESKINSTLKIGILMRYLEGPRDYYAPPLKTAPVFGGIAGIIHSEGPSKGEGVGPEGAAEGQDPVVPNLSSRNKEVGEMQDMYRRTLAAFWTSQPGELRADECVEDIFAGGDGWGKNLRGGNGNGNANANEEQKDGRARGGSLSVYGTSSRPGSGTNTPTVQEGDAVKITASPPVGGTGGMMGRHKKGGKHRAPKKGAGEVDEADVRDDLISWRIGERAYV
jgi:hypothetical protein